MQNPRLAARYAKSLLDFSVEQNQLEQVYADMQWLQDTSRSNRDFYNLLRSPVISGDKKLKILQAVANGRLNKTTEAFITLLIKKGRENVLAEMATAFIGQYKEHKNIKIVSLTTAVPVSDAVKQALIEQVKKTTDFSQIELQEKVNPDLIGGFVLQVGDKLIDASIAYDLKSLAKQFENNDFIYKIR